MMRPPLTKKIGDRQYIETDLLIVNPTPQTYKLWGGNPVVWNEISGTVIQSQKYMIGPARLSAKQMGVGDVAHLLNENSPDVCCGVIDNEDQTKITSEIPKFKARGVISGVTGFYNIQVGDGKKITSVSKQQIINYFNQYLADKNDTGKRLYWYDPSNRKIELKTWDDVYERYSQYFVHEYEMYRQAEASLAGSLNPKGFYSGSSQEVADSGLWAMFKNSGLSTQAIKQELLDYGYTSAQISAFLNQKEYYAKTSSGSGGSGSSSGGTGHGNGGGSNSGRIDSGLPTLQSDSLTTIQIQRSRNLFGDSLDVGNAFTVKNNAEKDKYLLAPQIFQLVPSINKEFGFVEYIPNRYIFIHKPNEIQYSGLGSEWVSIDRNGGFSFVDWKKFQLLQISFTFVIAKTADGLLNHVEDEIQLLRKIAQTPYPVSFFNFDSMFTQEFRYDSDDFERSNNLPTGIQFVITDFSITAQQRDSSMRITRAQASMTLQEIPIEKQKLISMPRLVPKNKKTPPTPDDPSGQFALPSGALNTGFVDKDFNYNPSDILS